MVGSKHTVGEPADFGLSLRSELLGRIRRILLDQLSDSSDSIGTGAEVILAVDAEQESVGSSSSGWNDFPGRLLGIQRIAAEESDRYADLGPDVGGAEAEVRREVNSVCERYCKRDEEN